jgi:hypothetical protein
MKKEPENGSEAGETCEDLTGVEEAAAAASEAREARREGSGGSGSSNETDEYSDDSDGQAEAASTRGGVPDHERGIVTLPEAEAMEDDAETSPALPGAPMRDDGGGEADGDGVIAPAPGLPGPAAGAAGAAPMHDDREGDGGIPGRDGEAEVAAEEEVYDVHPGSSPADEALGLRPAVAVEAEEGGETSKPAGPDAETCGIADTDSYMDMVAEAAEEPPQGVPDGPKVPGGMSSGITATVPPAVPPPRPPPPMFASRGRPKLMATAKVHGSHGPSGGSSSGSSGINTAPWREQRVVLKPREPDHPPPKQRPMQKPKEPRPGPY